MLDRYFKQELSDIYREILEFREGVKSLEVYNKQLQSSGDSARGKSSLFSQMLHFLSLKNEIGRETELEFLKSGR